MGVLALIHLMNNDPNVCYEKEQETLRKNFNEKLHANCGKYQWDGAIKQAKQLHKEGVHCWNKAAIKKRDQKQMEKVDSKR